MFAPPAGRLATALPPPTFGRLAGALTLGRLAVGLDGCVAGREKLPLGREAGRDVTLDRALLRDMPPPR